MRYKLKTKEYETYQFSPPPFQDWPDWLTDSRQGVEIKLEDGRYLLRLIQGNVVVNDGELLVFDRENNKIYRSIKEDLEETYEVA